MKRIYSLLVETLYARFQMGIMNKSEPTPIHAPITFKIYGMKSDRYWESGTYWGCHTDHIGDANEMMEIEKLELKEVKHDTCS